MNRSLALLGMAKKAGLLAVGGEATAAAVRRGEARLIITASDASDGSVRRAKANAESNNVEYIAVPYTMFELGSTAGRGSPGTIAFLDKGLADGFKDRLAESHESKMAEGHTSRSAEGHTSRLAEGHTSRLAEAETAKESDA